MHPIELRGARTHHLQGVDLELRPGELCVVTGVSGAGKSSLCFDTLYAEAQRRFVESFSPYARQFLERLERPPIDELDPVAAGVAVDRRAPIKSSRSTVATMADVEAYFNALFAREARPLCPECNELAVHASAASAASAAVAAHPGARALVSYPRRVAGTEEYLDVREALLRDGYGRLCVAGQVRELEALRPSEAIGPGGVVDVLVDRVVAGERSARRLGAAIEEAWTRSEGRAHLHWLEPDLDPVRVPVSRGLVCPSCGRGFAPPTAGLFSYQSPVGACSSCRGFGRTLGIDWGKVVPDESLSLAKHAIRPWSGRRATRERRLLAKYCEREGIPFDRPWAELSAEQRSSVIEGEGSRWRGKYPGVRTWFRWLETKSYKMHVRVFLARYRAYDPCPECHGKRLSAQALGYRVDGLDIGDWHALELRDCAARLARLVTHTRQGELARDELRTRLGYLERVGLGYVSLDRQARTLSGGEAQRVSLTAALGSSLTGALFVLDEPTVGLHPTDLPPLLDAMRELADHGNVVLVVEHEPLVVSVADRVLELGPGAGRAGGRIVFDGSPAELAARSDPASRVAAAPARAPRQGALGTPVEPAPTRSERASRSVAEGRGPSGALVVQGARANNLQSVSVSIPLGAIVGVCGPSGSGKSSLVEEVLYRGLARARGYRDVDAPGPYLRIEGASAIHTVTLVDASPLGRTSRGNAATYSHAWDRLRELFAAAPESVVRGFGPGHFSFNVAGGRCEACAGEGAETVEMQFLADVRLECPVCHGRRFRDEVLEVQIAGRSVADFLAASVDEVLELYDLDHKLTKALRPLSQLGLGYLPLGQPLTALSGGEAQRLKLARSLGDASVGSLYLLDEPSAGLHPTEVVLLNRALDALVAQGASVVVVDHDLGVLAAADWLVELGPGAGAGGGRVVAEGSPAELAALGTRTGSALAARLGRQPSAASDLASNSSSARALGRKTRESRAPRSLGANDASRRTDASRPNDATRSGAASRPSAARCIEVVGAREHNLASLDVRIPHGELVVVTGPSGSGKSTLAFDVVFAEGQRRFLETLTPYARQYLPALPRPDVDRVAGVPPSVALEQRTSRAGAGSTVATVTEVAHYLRLLFAKVGVPHCPTCDEPVRPASPDEILARLRSRRGPQVLRAPVVRGRKGTYLDVFTVAARAGIDWAIVDGAIAPTDPPPKLAKTAEHDIDLVVKVGELGELDRDSFDRALRLGRGQLLVAGFAPESLDAAGPAAPARPVRGAAGAKGKTAPRVKRTRAGHRTPVARASVPASLRPPEPGDWRDDDLFSTRRACPSCGFAIPELDPRWFSFNTKQGRCPDCEGTGFAGGVTEPVDEDTELERCSSCQGSRLAPIARAVRLLGERYHEHAERSVASMLERAERMRFSGPARLVAEAPLAELLRRLRFVAEVGLGYLSLDRRAETLSGGEMQRLRLAAQLGSGLTGALYVLDEPTIGLHPRDTARLLGNLRRLVDTGSTVLVVEHDADTIRAADTLIDLGPAGGRGGGRVVADGPAAEVLADPRSPTGRALATERDLYQWRARRPASAERIVLREARTHNLKISELAIPTERLCVVAGVSGSGKSTLVRQVLFPAVRRALGQLAPLASQRARVELPPNVARVIAVDQSPIGRTPRSVPATFLGIWDTIRRLFAATPEARTRGYKPARFSFNSGAGGRCSSCDGMGVIAHEMSFLPDVKTRCESCGGSRFEPATLDVRYLGLTVGEVLRLTAQEGAELFAAHHDIATPLALLCDLGLGYLQIGQGSPTLSGGEAQRLKLATELAAGRGHLPTLYVLDEPTTGLHHSDVGKLIAVLDRLVERGDSLVVIEHHPAVIAAADHVIELGPEGGERGGRVVGEGSPIELARRQTPTGDVLRKMVGA